MTTDAQGKIELETGINYLLETDDEMLIELAGIIKANDDFPSEEELTQLLTFSFTFAMGCQEMKLSELSNIFNTRAKKFMVALSKWGMHSGRTRDFVKKRWDLLAYNRIVNKATAIAAYKAAGSVNKY